MVPPFSCNYFLKCVSMNLRKRNEEGILCTTEKILSLNGHVDQIWEMINTVTGTPIAGNLQLSSVMTQALSDAVLFLSAAR